MFCEKRNQLGMQNVLNAVKGMQQETINCVTIAVLRLLLRASLQLENDSLLVDHT
jgi:hypothetical protein